MVRTGLPLAGLISDLKVFPQTIRNVRVRQKTPFAEIPSVQSAIAAAGRELDGNGRVVVRYSGTEALARVMVEADQKIEWIASPPRSSMRFNPLSARKGP